MGGGASKGAAKPAANANAEDDKLQAIAPGPIAGTLNKSLPTKAFVTLSCHCGAVEVGLFVKPLMVAYCHCKECRTSRETSIYGAVPIKEWKDGGIQYLKGGEHVVEYSCAPVKMSKWSCRKCQTALFNSNKFDFRVIGLDAIRRSNNGKLPEGFEPQLHLFYSERVLGPQSDGLPKFKDFPLPMGSGSRLDDNGNSIEVEEEEEEFGCG